MGPAGSASNGEIIGDPETAAGWSRFRTVRTDRTMNLEPIDPETAVELYIAEREADAAASTVRSHRSRLNQFIRWCDERDIENLNELTGRTLHEYRLWRRNDGNLAKASLNCQMDTLRVFVRFLGTIDGVHQDLHEKVRSPDLHPGEDVREVMLDSEQAEAVWRTSSATSTPHCRT